MRRLHLPLVPRPFRWLLVVSVASVLLYYSVFAPPGSGAIEMGPLGLFPYSNWLHVTAYVGLAGAVVYALYAPPRSSWYAVGGGFLAAFCYGIGIEFVQSMLPARTFALADMGLNALGAGVAAIVWLGLFHVARFYRLSAIDDAEPVVQ